MQLSIDKTFEHIRDPRIAGKVEHSLPALLKLIMLGKLCGRVTIKESWRMGKRLPKEALMQIGFKNGTPPCYSTLTETFKSLDENEVRLVLATAVRGLNLEYDEVVAVDGKTLCGSAKEDSPAIKLLTAFSARIQGVIGEVKVGDKTNEITAMLDLLDKVDLSNMIITGDAAFAQKNICNKVVEKNADFVFTVKDNQPSLKACIEAATDAAKASFFPSGSN